MEAQQPVLLRGFLHCPKCRAKLTHSFFGMECHYCGYLIAFEDLAEAP